MEEPPARHIPPAFDPVVQKSSQGLPSKRRLSGELRRHYARAARSLPIPMVRPGLNEQYVQTTNFLYAVFDKATGNITFGPYYVKSLFQGFGRPV